MHQRRAGPAGRAHASAGAPAPLKSGSPRPAASPRPSDTPRHGTATRRAPGGCGSPARPPPRHPAHDDALPRRTRAPDAGRRRSTAAAPTRGRSAARRTPDGWRSTGRHSSRRPPPGQRDAGLQVVHLRVQQLVLHQQFADLGLQPTVGVVPDIRRAALQARLARSQKLIAPLRGPRCRDPQHPRHGLEILSAQQAQYHRALAPSRKPLPTAPPGGRSIFCTGRGRPSGRYALGPSRHDPIREQPRRGLPSAHATTRTSDARLYVIRPRAAVLTRPRCHSESVSRVGTCSGRVIIGCCERELSSCGPR